MCKIISSLPADRGPVILFSKGVHHSTKEMVDSGADVIGLDWTADMADLHRQIGGRAALQGNLDPIALYSDPDRIALETARMLRAFVNAVKQHQIRE